MIGWLTDKAAADAYFLADRLDSTAWDALLVTSVKDEKTAVLKMAYNRIRLCSDFDLPAIPTADQLDKLVIAQCEMAYYLAQHLSDEDRRKGLQAQGVTAAGIVKETYGDGAGKAIDLAALPIPAIVRQALYEFEYVEPGFYAVDIDRREDKGVGESVVDLDDTDY